MKDEIKEILDFKENADYKRLSCDEIQVLLDYITNLQQDYERLNKNWQRLDDYLHRMLNVSVGEYKKAIQETIYMVNMLKEIKENNNG